MRFRDQTRLTQTTYKLLQVKCSFGYSGAVLWNSLPLGLKKLDSLDALKGLGKLTDNKTTINQAPTLQSCKTDTVEPPVSDHLKCKD